MPDIDGLEATRAIRAAEAPGLHVPIYALTAHALPSDRDRCFAAGMDGFIAKPISVDEVLQLVSKLAAGTANAMGRISLSILRTMHPLPREMIAKYPRNAPHPR